MKIHLISKDAGLQRSCREILARFPGKKLELLTGPRPDENASKADVYIWDYCPELTAGPGWSIDEEGRNLFLVHRRQVTNLLEKIPMARVGILLKPVAEATLAAFLEHSLSRFEARKSTSAKRADPQDADRDEMLQCLLHANLKLQEYDHDRTNFLARAAHDFRAPLTAVNGYCGLLLADMLGPLSVEQKEVLQRMQHSVKRLSRMSNAMFDLSAGLHIERRLNLQKGNMEDCIDQALHEMGPFTEEKQIAVTVQLQPPVQPLYFERVQMEQVMINLFDNACKFTPKLGAIEVRGYPFFWERRSREVGGARVSGERRLAESRRPNAYRIDIRDSGHGISDENLESIFEEYTSYAGPQDRSGGGLGLAICKSILTQHHGRIWAESRPEGALLCVVLPNARHEIAFHSETDSSSRITYAQAGSIS